MTSEAAWLPDRLARRAAGRAAVVVDLDREGHDDDAAVLTGAASVQVVALADEASMHVELTAEGPFDLVVDTTGATGVRRRLAFLLYHLRPGGLVVVRRPRDFPRADRRLLAHVEELEALGAGDDVVPPHLRRDERPVEVRDTHALAASLVGVRVGRHHVQARLGVHVLAKVTEDEADRVLERRPDAGRVLHRVRAATWQPTGSFTSTSGADHPLGEVRAPELRLRVHHDVTCGPRLVAVAASPAMVLPGTFRRPGSRRVTTPVLVDWDQRFVRDPGLEPARRLEGHWFDLDNLNRAHFGHALTEQVSTTWAWQRALAEHPDLRAFAFRGRGPGEVAEWEHRLLESAGVPRDRWELLEEPVRVEHLVTASPAYSIDQFVHPVMRSVYATMGRALSADRAPSSVRRVFLTRRGGLRRCLNVEAVEALFARHGFDVVLPEELDLGEQAALVRGADVLAGFGGSAMIQLALAERPVRAFVVTSDNYHAANERHLSALLGHHLMLVRGRATVAPTATFSNRAFHSPFTLDLDVEGRVLERALDAL